MGFEFRDSAGRPCGSTEFAKSLLADGLAELSSELAAAIGAEGKWRENYQHYFYEISRLEITDAKFDWGKLAAAIPDRLVNDAGESLSQLAARGFANRNPLKFEQVVGTGVRKAIELPEVASTLDESQATKDSLLGLDYIRANRNLDVSGDLLVALAGYAELSATKSWLDWGGTVAVIGRQRDATHQALVAYAQSSAGTLYFVDGGIDLVAQIETAAHFLRTLSHTGKRIVVASFGYAPGANQIKLQAAQIALTQVAMQLPKAQVALAWLATPLDVVVSDAQVVHNQIAAWNARKFGTKLRDRFWRTFGYLQPCAPELVQPADLHQPPLGLFDASANLQGPSYLLAKHSERWVAMQAARSGVRISFVVAPPAETRSVLGARRVLARTFRGLARFGVHPLPAGQTATLMAALLARSLHDPAAPQSVSATGIHAGLWNLAYRVDSIWVPATLLG